VASRGACDLDGLGRSLAVAGIPGRPRRPGTARAGVTTGESREETGERAGEKSGDWRAEACRVSDRQRLAGVRGRWAGDGNETMRRARDGVRYGAAYST
jgi:hypothetical protein